MEQLGGDLLYYHQAAKYADIIISTREEFDILESLTHPGNDDDRLSAEAYLESPRLPFVCIKHGENGANVFTFGRQAVPRPCDAGARL